MLDLFYSQNNYKNFFKYYDVDDSTVKHNLNLNLIRICKQKNNQFFNKFT